MPATPPSPPTSGNQLVELLREAMQSPLEVAFADVVDGLRQPMLDRLERMELDRAPYLDGLLALKDRREAILRGFREDMASAWRAAAEGDAPAARFGQEQAGSDLGLVEEDELDVRLATEQLADVISREWQAELLRLNGYLTWLDMGVRLAPDSAPYSPARIAMAVYRGFVGAALPGNVRALAVQCCSREFVELLGPIYESMHARLVRRLGPQDSASPRMRRTQAIPSTGDESASEPDWMTRFFVSWDEEGDAAGPSPDVATLPPALHQLLEESRQQRALSQAGVRSAATRTSLSQRELVAALTLLQIASPEVHEEVLADPKKLQAAFKQQIFLQAAQLGVAPEAVAISDADENVVDLVGMLFEVIFRESHLGDEQVHVLGRLMAPMTKVALQDRKLFLQATHSARRLLNVLVEACDGNAGENEAQRLLLEKVRDTVQRLVADFDESQTVFRAARTDFNDFYARYRDEADKAEQVLAAEQQVKDAEAHALAGFAAHLEARLQGRDVPAAMRRALQEGWPAYAVRMQSLNKPQAAPMMLDGLVQAVDDALVRGDVRAWHAAMDWLQPMWMASGRPRAAIAALREELFAALVVPQETPVAVAATEPAAAPAAEPASTAPVLPGLLDTHEWVEGMEHLDPVMTEYFQQLREGSWLDFVDKDNRVQAGRLSWISPVSRRLMYVNRAGSRICVASVQELVVMAQLGRVRMHRDEDAFYSAMQGVVDRLVMPAQS